MTVNQCFEIFKRHIGRGNSAYINQDEKELEDKFRWLLNPAISHICSVLKPVKIFRTEKRKNEAVVLPDDFFSIKKVFIGGKEIRSYTVIENAVFTPDYSGDTEIIYCYLTMTDSTSIDNTPIDLPAAYENLVPLYIAAQAVKNEDEGLYRILSGDFHNQISVLKKENISQTHFDGIQRIYTI